MHLSLNTLLAIGSVLAWENTQAISPVAQPQRVASARIASPSQSATFVDPEGDTDAIIEQLGTVDDFREFLDKHCSQRNVDGAGDFIATFRQSPEALQAQGWQGPCNNLAEFSAHWAYVHGGAPYIVSLCPPGITDKFSHPWHQLAICQEPCGRLLIFDNTTLCEWDGSLEEYVRKEHPALVIAPVGGVVPWKQVRETFRARILEHVRGNTDELMIAELPRRSATQGPPVMLAADIHDEGVPR